MSGRRPRGAEARLPGGADGGAWRLGDTVRRQTGYWTPAVHALLRHLDRAGFRGAPRVLGIDEGGREVLTYLPGASVGDDQPWPPWVHSEAALDDVGGWLRSYHDAVATFVPPPGARWRLSRRAWQLGDVVGHGDAGPYNAVWREAGGPSSNPTGSSGSRAGSLGRLVGFVDWDHAAPVPRLHDLALVAFSWVPLHAREVVEAEGFTGFADRPRRLWRLLRAYGYDGPVAAVVDAVEQAVRERAATVRALTDGGDPLATRLVATGTIDRLDQAVAELAADRAVLGAEMSR